MRGIVQDVLYKRYDTRHTVQEVLYKRYRTKGTIVEREIFSRVIFCVFCDLTQFPKVYSRNR